jgi:MoaA/NifB/PqqE/SkfB family radical SAM enzyme
MSNRRTDIWRPFGVKLLGFETSDEVDGEIKFTGLLKPIVAVMKLPIAMYLQSQLYSKYDLGMWEGRRIANPFAPPVGSYAQLRALKAIAKSHLLGRSYPLVITFAVTYRCQLRCAHCSAVRHIRRNERELNTKEAKRVIDESLDMGVAVVTFTGGEPLMREDIFDLISHVDKRKAITLLFTNGFLLTDDVLNKLKEAGLYSLFVSLDSVDPDEHDTLRGRLGVFRAAVEGIERALNKGMMVTIASYASRSNTKRHHFLKMHKLGRKLGVHMVMFFDCISTGALLHDTSEMLTPQQKRRIAQYSAYNFNLGTRPIFVSQAWQNSPEGYLSGVGCVAGHLQYYVSAYGDVQPCDFTPLSFGNIRQTPLKRIWKRMIRHPAYNHLSRRCRMQNFKFRELYIDPIPDEAPLPYPIGKLPRLDYRSNVV